MVVSDVVHFILQFQWSGCPVLDKELFRLNVTDDEVLERVSYVSEWRLTMGRIMRTWTIEDSMNPAHDPFRYYFINS